jgi:hypothetical protein
MSDLKGFPMPPTYRPPTPQAEGYASRKDKREAEAGTPLPKPAIEAVSVADHVEKGMASQHTLTLDETSEILNATLLPAHRDDPNVLRFIGHFLNCRDVKEAARKSGITAGSGQVLRDRPDIHNAIVRLTDKALVKYGYDAHELVERVKEVAFVDPADFENEDGSYVESLRSLPPATRRAIKKFKVKNLYEKDPNGMDVVVGKLIEVELYDRMKAVETLGPEKEVFVKTQRVQHDVTQNMKDTLLASKDRADRHAASMIQNARNVYELTPPEEDGDEGET